jgi:hypothetical protein
MKLTFNTNHWRFPSTPTYLEGGPSPEQREREEAAARTALALWKPGPEAFEMLDRLRLAVGHTVVVQGWDPIMFMMDDEGPYPVQARCVDIVVRDDAEGRPRAYLVLENASTVATPNGYEAADLLIRSEDQCLFGLHFIYEVEVNAI